MLCYRKGLARRGELPVAAAYRAAVGLAVRSGRPCPYLGLPGGLAQGNRAAQLDMAKKQGGLGPRSAVAFRRAQGVRLTAVHVTCRVGGAMEDPGRSARASSPRAAKAALSASGAAYRRAHTRTPRRTPALRGVLRPGRGSSPPGPTWGPGRAASRAGRIRTAGAAAAAQAARGMPAPGSAAASGAARGPSGTL